MGERIRIPFEPVLQQPVEYVVGHGEEKLHQPDPEEIKCRRPELFPVLQGCGEVSGQLRHQHGHRFGEKAQNEADRQQFLLVPEIDFRQKAELFQDLAVMRENAEPHS